MNVQEVWVVFDTKRFEIVGVYYLMTIAHRVRERLTEKLMYGSEATAHAGPRYGVMRLESAIEIMCRNAVISSQQEIKEAREDFTEEGHLLDIVAVD